MNDTTDNTLDHQIQDATGMESRNEERAKRTTTRVKRISMHCAAINFSFLRAARAKSRKAEGREERERERGASLRQRGTSWRFIFPGLVVENARLATTFSNDNNYPRETALPIRRERLLFFIYRQAHYFCASKHIKNSPLARAFQSSSSSPFPSASPPFARRGYRPVQRPRVTGFIKLVAAKSGDSPPLLSVPLVLSLSLLPRNFLVQPAFACHSSIRRSVIGIIIAGRLDTTILHRSFDDDTYRSVAWERNEKEYPYRTSTRKQNRRIGSWLTVVEETSLKRHTLP